MNVMGNWGDWDSYVEFPVDGAFWALYKTPRQPLLLSKITVWVKPGPNEQEFRGFLYADGTLLAETPFYEVGAGAEAGWVDLRFTEPVLIEGEEIALGVNINAEAPPRASLGIEESGNEYGEDEFDSDEPVPDEPGAPSEAGNPLIFATIYDAWDEPEVEDLHLGRLPFPQAQEAFAGGVARVSEVQAGWHGTVLSPETGSFALVNQEGPLADKVGDRLRVTVGLNNVFVYVLGEAELEDDISLTRRAFLALGPLAADSLDVTVGVAE